MSSHSTEPVYYCEDLTAVPYHALVKGLSASAPPWLAKFVARLMQFRRLIGWRLPPCYGVADIHQVTLLTPDQVPSQAAAKWAPIMEQLHDLSFGVLQYRLPFLIGARQQCVCLLRHTSGQAIATVEWMRMPGPGQIEEQLVVEFNSYAEDDPDVLTGSLKAEHLLMADAFRPEFVDVLFLPNTLPLQAVWKSHQERTGQRAFYSLAADAAVQVHLQRSDRRFQWMLQRGYLRRLSAKEIARVKQLSL